MKIERAASVPLIVHDPYFSIWSGGGHLNDCDTSHWSGARQAVRGYVVIDGTPYCFMGDPEFSQTIGQTGLSVTPTSTEYQFENEWITMQVRFTSPLLLDDLLLVSRPCTYLDVTVSRKKPAGVRVVFAFSSDLVKFTDGPVNGDVQQTEKFRYGVMGKAFQTPLGHSGDHTTIDWGYLYLAGCGPEARFAYDSEKERLDGIVELGTESESGGIVAAYDDLVSINYFGQWRKAYWTKEYPTIFDAIGASLDEREDVLKKSEALDRSLTERAREMGGEDYELLCCLSYRQAVAAHKLIEDEDGNLIFLSKENDSNGCIGTADVSYPSVPLFLMYSTDYIKGMLRPVFRFASCDVWEYDFAPHDVGRYPYAWGQVYGLNPEKKGKQYLQANGAVFPPYYQYPPCDVYDLKFQMPVEECGNMLIMTAACCEIDKNAEFAKPYQGLLKTWTEYLLTYGADPGEQLCTDDFAGHLAHNTNLAVKAIMGIKAFARILELLGDDSESMRYRSQAAAMAAVWETTARGKGHTALTFGDTDSWSLKYNLVWDRFFGDPLFSGDIISGDLAWYVEKCGEYGTPLDSRSSYTKSDWILWCASMAGDKEMFQALTAPVAAYVRETESRVPFSDWYDTVSGRYCHFIARSVQGGIYMPMFMERFKK